ncbi:MAG TPA: Rieske 2Fe-2S domain-containing protein, partial [Saprospiraceae bacterium]|nr:Rieske 2Fe-2S domain-containing protein [Saprospiraceae bacterium]
MNRREFVKRSCILCASGGLLPVALSSCQATHYVSGTLESTGITVLKSEFTYARNKKIIVRQYIIVQNEKLEFPIYVYRFSENEFSALWMKCAHQGAELQASGDHLQCPSHGSEYTNRGV